jgi:signal transduction histidine kinase
VQTKTFLVLCTLAGLIFLWFVYALRVRQVTARERSRLETRLLERERIARELHDTLFQGLLSASLQLQVADSEIPRDTRGKHRVERVVQLLQQAIDEGRSAVRDLRAASKPDDLERAFAQIPQDLAVDEKIEYRLILQGKPRALRPSIRDEVYRISREALTNAFQHSRCKLVETVLQYASNRFRLVIRDDGCGMDPAIVRSGREGHWGLSGMRERSERIGARLTVRSAIGAGTEIDLIVSGRAAFEPTGNHSPLDWLAKLYALLGD